MATIRTYEYQVDGNRVGKYDECSNSCYITPKDGEGAYQCDHYSVGIDIDHGCLVERCFKPIDEGK